jgi:hypothetical protein
MQNTDPRPRIWYAVCDGDRVGPINGVLYPTRDEADRALQQSRNDVPAAYVAQVRWKFDPRACNSNTW